jgi:hypothetical protein
MGKFQAATTNPDEQNTTVEHTRVSTSRMLPHLDASLFLISSCDIEWKVSIVSLQSSSCQVISSLSDRAVGDFSHLVALSYAQTTASSLLPSYLSCV